MDQKDIQIYFRHWCKIGMFVFCYNKIKGETPSVRKQLRKLDH